MLKQQVLKKIVSLVLIFALVLSLFNLSIFPSSTVHAAPGDSLGILEIKVNKPLNAVVDLSLATIHISLPYGTLYQMLNVTTNPSATATLYRSNGTTAISFAASGINKGDAKMDQFSTNGTTLYYLQVADKNNSSNSKKYTVTVSVDNVVPHITGPMGPNDNFSPLNIHAGENAWDVMGASKIGNGSTTSSIEGPGTPSSYSGKAWSESVYERSGDYPAASTVNESWLGDNMYLQTIGKNDLNALTKYGIANVHGASKLNSDILRYHEFLPFVTPDGVSRDDGDRGAVNSDRQRLEIKSNTGAANIAANSVGGDIMTHHWRFMLPSETLRFQHDVGDKHAGDFIEPHRFWHIFQLKEVAGNAAGQPVTTLTLVSSGGKGQLEFRNNPDGNYADRIKPLFTIPFDKVVDRWLDLEVTILTADKGYVYGKLVDLETDTVMFEGGMTAETYRRPEVKNPTTGRDERGDLPVESGQQNRSKWGLYRGLYNGERDAAYADEFQAATMYLADVHLIKRDEEHYIFPDGWNPNVQPKNVVAWARPSGITASKGAAFSSLGLPSQLDATLSTGKTEKVNVTWNPANYQPNSTGINQIYGEFNGTGITNTQNIQPYIEVTLTDYKNWAVTPGAKIKVVSSGTSNPKEYFIDDETTNYWQANSSLVTPDAGNHQYWAAVQLEKKIEVSKIQIEWTNNSSYLNNYQLYYTNDAAAYDELVEGNNFSTSTKGTEKPLQTVLGASWIPISGAGKTTPLANNEKVDLTLDKPIAAQYVLLVSDVNQSKPSGSGVGIRSNVFRVFGESLGSLTLNKNSFSLEVGQTESLQAQALPGETPEKKITWASDNPLVAAVDTNGVVTGKSAGTAVITASFGSLSQTCTVTVSDAPGIPSGSVSLLAPSRFTPQAGVNIKVSSEASDHPGVDALKSGGSGYWRNSNSDVYMSNYSPSSLALTLDLGTPKTIDKLYLEIPNIISNIQSNATRFEVYYSNDPKSWASAPVASGPVKADNYDWKANGWMLAGGTETEGLWSYVTYNGQKWGYDTKTFLYPFTARYVMVNTVLVGPRDKRTDDNKSLMGISGLAIYGKDSVTNATALVPAKGTYSTWDQASPISTQINLAGGQTLTSIIKGGTTLRLGTDYSLSGNTVTLAPSYLAKLPLGTNEFTFHFNNGDPSIFALDVTARGYGGNTKTIKMNAIEGVSPYNILGGAMGTDESVEGVTKRIRDAYHAFYGDQPRATAADDHIQSIWDNTLKKNVFKIFEYGRGLNNEFLDKTRDGEYGHKGVFDWNLGYVVDGAATTDRQRVEIRPSEDSTGDFVAYEGDLVSYNWLWNIPDGNQWNQPNFRHIFQLKAVNAQVADTLPGGNTGGENGAYIVAMSISGTTSRDLVVNHNRYDGDKTLLKIPLKEIDGHWIKVELNALISDSGWLTVKITDTVTGKVYTFDSPDVYQAFANQGAGDGVKDLWRRPERTGSFETEYPATFDQYERPKWGIYRSSANGTNSAYDAELQLADITIGKAASGVSSVNLALNKKAYNVGPTVGANLIQMQSANTNEYGNANKLTNGVLQDPTKWAVTNVTSLNQIGNYSWLGTDGDRKGSFVIDLGQAMDFSQMRLFAKSNRLKGATVYVSDDFANHTAAADFDAMIFKQVDKRTAQGYTYATGNTSGGTDTEDGSYPIDLGNTYHSRYIKVTVENASGGNTGTDLTGPPRLTQVQVFNAPRPPQNLRVEVGVSAKNLKWDSNDLSEGYTVYNGTTVLADLPKGTTSYTIPVNITDLTQITVRSKGTDPYSRKFMISAPALPGDPQVLPVIIGITPENITTKAGKAPVMPTVVTAVYNNNTTQQLGVVWDNIAVSQYASAGSFTVQGTVTSTTYKALANITVTAADIPVPVIVNIQPISITTKAGAAPVLPTVVTAVYSNDTTRQLAVTWDQIVASQYASAGSFTVQGAVASTSIKARATVTVTQPTWPSSSSLTVSGVTPRTATLTWTAAEAGRGLSGYKIYSVTDSTYTEIASLGNVQMYELTGLTPNSNYTYIIQAIDSDGTRSVYGPMVNFRTNSTSSGSRSGSTGAPSTGAGNATAPAPDSSGNTGTIDLEKDAKVTKETTADGKTVTKVIVDADKLDKALLNPIVRIEAKGSDFAVNVELPSNSILNAISKLSSTVIQIQTNGTTYELPVSVFKNIPKDSTVSVTISEVSGKAGADIDAAVKNLNAKQVISNPIEFTIRVSGKEISDFGGVYVNRTISLGTTVDSSKVTAVWMDSSNQPHFVPATITTKNGSTVITIHSPHNSIYTVIQSEKSFADLQGHWAKADIELLANKWIINGTTDQQFTPEINITRAEFAAMLVRSLGLLEVKADGFRDVQPGDWFAGAIGTANKAGLINGYEDGTFRPGANITREQMVAMMIRAMKVGDKEIQADNTVLNRFDDRSDIGSWSRAAVSQALTAGLIQGVSDNAFAPNEPATRAQAATILKRMLQALQFIN
ncbi:S-layer homology domain-containing protein [Paenibacillus radicis (ex Xue et al. 2023)]|uniref:S-layer homology domain-containing protein n=1 Tax=Paenibacillus radicis (ex Xue et al. 2023) TaxID=2972489 RepID=A0ABT1YIV7_9BACL|nr:S-layer homology domain-containing protein [Paenibacillus radicis (ex Xue et al. 2023)]MCR8632675.1 S-layer homology domain-containing protein [Paenibacillus radicis (ex Xue et al. 2023)]